MAAATTIHIYVDTTVDSVSVTYYRSTGARLGSETISGGNWGTDWAVASGGYAYITAISSDYDPIIGTSTLGTSEWYITNASGTIVDASISSVQYETREVTIAAKIYTVTFDGNGGTPGATTESGTYGSTIETTATLSGYNFAGWYTSASGGTQRTTIVATETLYAHWEVAHTYYYNVRFYSGTSNHQTAYVTGLSSATNKIFFSNGNLSPSNTNLSKTGEYTAIRYCSKDDTLGYFTISDSATSALPAILGVRVDISTFTWTSDDTTNIKTGQSFSGNIKATGNWETYQDKLKLCALGCGASYTKQSTTQGATLTTTLFNTTLQGLRDVKTELGRSDAIMSDVSRGDIVYASYFLHLKNMLNNMISGVNSQTQ